MTDEEFEGWVELHRQATGANRDAAASLLANREIFVNDWAATPAELGECTRRLVLNLRVPKFPSDHAEDVAAELMALRRERDEAARQQLRDEAASGARCGLCGDSGLVTLLHPLCVEAPHDGPPRIVNYRDPRTVGDYGRVVEISAQCECPTGRSQRGGHITLANYRRRLPHGVPVTAVVALLDAHRRAHAARVRETLPVFRGAVGPGPKAVAGSVGEVVRNTKAQQGEAA